MRLLVAAVIALGLFASACSRPSARGDSPTPQGGTPRAAAPSTPPSSDPAAPQVSGVYTADGETSRLTAVSAQAETPFNGQPVTAIIITAKPHDAGANLFDTLAGAYGDAIVVRVLQDGRAIGEDLAHHGLAKTNGHVSASGIVTMSDYRNDGRTISGHLTSNGPTTLFDQSINVDLTFHTRAP